MKHPGLLNSLHLDTHVSRESCKLHIAAKCNLYLSHLHFTLRTNFLYKTMGVFHLPRDSGNSGWVVNGTWFFGSFHWKISGKNGTSEKVVPFSRWKLPNGKFVFHLQNSRFYCFYHQFQTFRGLLNGQMSLGSLEWSLWQMERALPKRKFPNGNS